MATLFESTAVRSLILDILARRNWVEPKQLDEIEEQLARAGPGSSPEMVLVKGGYISDQEIATLYSEELFLDCIPSSLESGEVDKDLAGLLPEKLCNDK